MTTTAQDLKTRLVVGMEIHVELATRSKMFTAAPNVAHPSNFDAAPNTLCDPVVLGMPGVLPVINRDAVEMAMLVGLALGCRIAKFTKWDRKSYYYPDLPKNYQISQYDLPLCYDGAFDLPVTDDSGNLPNVATKRIGIIRAHLEEDAGKLLHEAPGGHAIDHSIVDLNRAGTPLLEIVTQPDFETPEQCVQFAQMLRDICRSLGVSEGIMQKGHIRFEPNINVHIERDGKTHETPIVEIKNLNSFKAVYGAVAYEYQRQVEEWLENGGVMKPGTSGGKSTRGWDDVRQATFLQREKEEAHDYRYFPDPDLVPVKVSDQWLEEVKARLTELPHQRLLRYTRDLELNEKEARQIIDEPRLCAFFEQVLAAGVEPRRASAVLLNNLSRRANEKGLGVAELGITPAQVAAIDQLVRDSKVSSSAADELYKALADEPDAAADPAQLAEARGLVQVSDDAALSEWCDAAIAANAKSVEAVKAGKDAAIGALVGAVMKLSKGKANPKVVSEMLRAKLRT
ncbi:MAG: Asp-tRNA(Asn)/Glu-tRNA(Gln) amidotransferase subunit GatB [Phycisphaeraceae bacterium]